MAAATPLFDGAALGPSEDQVRPSGGLHEALVRDPFFPMKSWVGVARRGFGPGCEKWRPRRSQSPLELLDTSDRGSRQLRRHRNKATDVVGDLQSVRVDSHIQGVLDECAKSFILRGSRLLAFTTSGEDLRNLLIVAPAGVDADPALLDRGRRRFLLFCRVWKAGWISGRWSRWPQQALRARPGLRCSSFTV